VTLRAVVVQPNHARYVEAVLKVLCELVFTHLPMCLQLPHFYDTFRVQMTGDDDADAAEQDFD
jgi:hypothetical protein